MKSSESTKWVLGFALALVWGLVFYRIYTKTQSDTTSYTVGPASIAKKQEEQKEYSLLLSYADPFGRTVKKVNRKVSKPSAKKQEAKPLKKEEPKKKIPFPQVKYQGMLRDGQSAREVGFFNISGKFVRIENGHEHEGLRLMEIKEDSVVFYFGEERKTILRGK